MRAAIVLFSLFLGLTAANEYYYTTLQQSSSGLAVKYIKQAKTSINALVYKFTDTDVYDALEKALKKGVRVSIVANADENGGKKSPVNKLASKGATVTMWSNPQWPKFHGKFAVIDNAAVIFGSENWTKNKKNLELLSVSNTRAVIDTCNTIFQQMTDNAQRTVSFLPAPQLPPLVGGTQGTFFYTSLEIDPNALAVNYINAATTSIRAVIYKFFDDNVFEAMERALLRGVRITLIADEEENDYDLSYFYQMAALGASTQIYKGKSFDKVHAKFAIFDEKVAVYGSQNWSVNSGNMELMIAVNLPSSVARLATLFNDIQGTATGKKFAISVSDALPNVH